jgi:hypothetical protein
MYHLHREKTTKDTLNIMFFVENVLVPLYGCMLSSVKFDFGPFFQNNMPVFERNTMLCTTR